MTYEERLFQISMAEFVLRQAEMQAMFSRMVVGRFQSDEAARRLRAQLERLPDSTEKASIFDQLSTLEASIDSTAETKALIAVLARQESDHEKMQACLASLRASLPPPPGKELP